MRVAFIDRRDTNRKIVRTFSKYNILASLVTELTNILRFTFLHLSIRIDPIILLINLIRINSDRFNLVWKKLNQKYIFIN